MDPITIGLLASQGLGVAQGIGSSFANNELQKRNRERLDELLARENQGKLGLTPAQQRLLDQRLQAPVAAAASDQRANSEQFMAAGGTSTGRDLSQLRREQVNTRAGGAVEAALQTLAADEQAQRQQEQEIESRMQAKYAMKADDMEKIFGALQQGAGVVGAAAGQPPATMQLSSMFGNQFSVSERNQLSRYAKQNPDKFIAELFGENTTAGTV